MSFIASFFSTDSVESLIDSGFIPTFLLCIGINRLFAKRVTSLPFTSVSHIQKAKNEFLKQLDQSQIAIKTLDANKQHYEVPTSYFEQVLGENLKYSCCLYDNFDEDTLEGLNSAEARMMDLYIERAGITDGMTVLGIFL